jgi:hypothetical protein
MSSRTLAAPLGPVIYAEHCDRADLGIGQRPDQPDQRAPGHDRAQYAGQPGPRTAGQRERDPFQQAPQSDRAALVLGGQPVHLLGERRHDAGRVVADEPADLEYDLDRTAATGQVLKAAPVTVVDPWCRLAALRAGHRRRARARHEPDQIATVLHLVQLQAAQVGEQQVGQAGFLSGQLMLHNRPPRSPR